ncbi:MAG: hypothetical protein ACXQS8_06530 [Candidatus Helarchaeales archaeon]
MKVKCHFCGSEDVEKKEEFLISKKYGLTRPMTIHYRAFNKYRCNKCGNAFMLYEEEKV